MDLLRCLQYCVVFVTIILALPAIQLFNQFLIYKIIVRALLRVK